MADDDAWIMYGHWDEIEAVTELPEGVVYRSMKDRPGVNDSRTLLLAEVRRAVLAHTEGKEEISPEAAESVANYLKLAGDRSDSQIFDLYWMAKGLHNTYKELL